MSEPTRAAGTADGWQLYRTSVCTSPSRPGWRTQNSELRTRSKQNFFDCFFASSTSKIHFNGLIFVVERNV
eukprot:scaffold6061_cov112-Skeletonema_marinoi.AAC.1